MPTSSTSSPYNFSHYSLFTIRYCKKKRGAIEIDHAAPQCALVFGKLLLKN